MARRVVATNSWIGGESKQRPDMLTAIQLQVLENMISSEGCLESYPGNLAVNAVAIESQIGYPAALRSMTRFYKNAQGYTLAACGGTGTGNPKLDMLWLDVDDAGRFLPIWSLASGNSIAPRVSFQEFNARLYFLQDWDTGLSGLYRYDGNFYATGTVSCDGSAVVTGVGTDFTLQLDGEPRIKPGDTIHIRRTGYSWGSSYYHVVDSVTDATHLKLHGNGPNTGGQVEYVTAGVHFVKWTPPAKPAGAAVGPASGLIEAGTRSYAFTYGCSWTGYESNGTISDPITCAALDKVTFTGITAYPGGSLETLQYDQIHVYSTFAGTDDGFYYAGTFARGGADYEFATASTLSISDDDLDLLRPMPTDHISPPIGCRRAWSFNDSLWLTDNGNILYKSAMGYGEYFPRHQWGNVNPEDIDAAAGGYFTFGQPGERIMAVAPLFGVYGKTGRLGTPLVVFTRTTAYQLSGWDWYEYARDILYQGGCVAPDAVTVSRNVVYYLGPEGPMVLSQGALEPLRLWRTEFPTLRGPFSAQCNPAELEKATVTTWGEYVVFAWPGPTATANNRCLLFDTENGAFMRLGTDAKPLNAACLSVWDGPGDDGGIYFGDSTKGKLWKMFAKTAGATLWDGTLGVPCEIKSPMVHVAGADGSQFALGRLGPYYTEWEEPLGATQAAEIAFYLDGSPTAAFDNAITLNAGAGGRIWRELTLDGENTHARCYEVGMTGTFTRTVRLMHMGFKQSLDGTERDR